MKISLVFLLFLGSILVSCDDSDVTPESVNIKFKFNALADNSPLVLNTKTYQNANGDSFNVSDFKFYASNVKLRNSQTGDEYQEPISYHLVHPKGDIPSYTFELKDVPTKAYDEIVFFVGIDKERNASIDAIGDLDPNNNMAWNWNTGYKFILLEGDVFKANDEKGGLALHVGTDTNYKEIKFKVSPMKFKDTEAEIEFDTEIMTIFDAPNVIDLSETSTIMFGATADKVAENYAKMFTLKQINF